MERDTEAPHSTWALTPMTAIDVQTQRMDKLRLRLGDLLKAHSQLLARLRPKPYLVHRSAQTYRHRPSPSSSLPRGPSCSFLPVGKPGQAEVIRDTHPDGGALLHELQQLGLGRPRVPQH